MDLDEKYLPDVATRTAFLENRIAEYKRQLFGGQLEILAAEKNGEKRTVVQQKDMMEQIVGNIDILVAELSKLSE